MFTHNQIAYEAAVNMRHETGKAAGAGGLKGIKFYTDDRLMNMTDGERADIQPDMAVNDEFHRTGVTQWFVVWE